ncbi:MAG: hypothetical protein KY453_11740 [Gemmatimonadetes bacterium]|nr:hypothetical protein [Gemmatimonadota bacterium]
MSDEKISGRYPGGPRRIADGDAPRPTTRLETEDERVARADQARRAAAVRRRRRRVVGVLLAACLLAGGGGFLLGLQADKASEELTAAREGTAGKGGLEGVLRGEANRVIQQMWLTEIQERQLGGR